MLLSGIVVPCYNEAKRIDQAAMIKHAKHGSMLLLVDDGSSDDTAQIIRDLSQNTQIECLVLDQNKGKAEAVRQGMLHLYNHYPEIEYLGFADADLATPLAGMEDLLIDMKCDKSLLMVLGSRWKHLGARIERNEKRHYMGRIFATLISNLFKLPIYDSQCGAKWFDRKVINFLFGSPFVSRWFFDVELLVRLGKAYPEALPAREIPLDVWTEVDDSRINWTDMLKAPLELIRIRKYYRNWSTEEISANNS